MPNTDNNARLEVSDDGLIYAGEEYSWHELSDSVIDLPCGCSVEPDQSEPCEHGYRSPLIVAGLI